MRYFQRPPPEEATRHNHETRTYSIQIEKGRERERAKERIQTYVKGRGRIMREKRKIENVLIKRG